MNTESRISQNAEIRISHIILVNVAIFIINFILVSYSDDNFEAVFFTVYQGIINFVLAVLCFIFHATTDFSNSMLRKMTLGFLLSASLVFLIDFLIIIEMWVGLKVFFKHYFFKH